ncbi:alpha-ketoacid dehydrogenase subunit beta [Undibacter mobilis]|uniref:Alpha-ketoacid dehydrogenase subunit beta n=1 Tax=Undibacter mobilis TaxID=2292256 RepID=A0A371B6K8_9BRAD|nr:transketolase C-terminal domain-containing protein [Undibacter mobilis]RDV03152.1 alpha-ketoacid dehydrogenase subunit beta [Undibacter mobilis]
MSRTLTYCQALSEGLVQAMERDESIFVTGIGVDYSSAVFGSTTEAVRKFGKERIFDAPAMENALTGIAIGAAAMGKRPLIVHLRNDFMFLAFDQMINLAAKWKYMYGPNAVPMPLVVRGIVGRGWGQGATHSQSLHGVLGHFPGLTVLAPATPADAKGMTIAALQADRPIVIIENRRLYDIKGPVDIEPNPTPLGRAFVRREGSDITIVGCSIMVQEALVAAQDLQQKGIAAEVVDIATVRPLDVDTITASIRKTGRLVVVDTDWEFCGLAAEIAALAAERCLKQLKAPVCRLGFADCPAPVSAPLEEAFYPKASSITKASLALCGESEEGMTFSAHVDTFKGPY